MDSICDKKECCGCTACYFACPVSAISIIEDEKGFKYPIIDKEKCINCKKCVKVCPINQKVNNIKNQQVFALKNKNENIRITSSSGGFFFELAKRIIEQKGIVYGAVFNEDCDVVHEEINKIEDIEKLKGSKYVQSNIGDTYKKIEEKLKEKKTILFSGTPCQVLGLIKYLGKDYENLITCDFVCHGVPSPKIFNEHKKYLEKKYKSKIEKITFRHKDKKSISNIKATFKNGSNYINGDKKDDYYFLFLKNCILRESCFNCHFANTNRVSDITMGDFWGVNKVIKKFDDGKGVSLVIINTNKGLDIYRNIEDKYYGVKSDINCCLQPQLIRPTQKTQAYDVFWREYSKKGYRKAVKKVKVIHFYNRVKNKVRRNLKMRSKVND